MELEAEILRRTSETLQHLKLGALDVNFYEIGNPMFFDKGIERSDFDVHGIDRLRTVPMELLALPCQSIRQRNCSTY